MPEKQVRYVYRVAHPERQTLEVIAENRLSAVQTAARIWRVPWPYAARACKVTFLRDCGSDFKSAEGLAGDALTGRGQADAKVDTRSAQR